MKEGGLTAQLSQLKIETAEKYVFQCDLKDREVDMEDIEKLYNKLNFIGWTETSAKVRNDDDAG